MKNNWADGGPVTISKFDWFYFDGKCFDFVHEIRKGDGTCLRTDQIHVPTKLIREALLRIDGKFGKIGGKR